MNTLKPSLYCSLMTGLSVGWPDSLMTTPYPHLPPWSLGTFEALTELCSNFLQEGKNVGLWGPSFLANLWKPQTLAWGRGCLNFLQAFKQSEGQGQEVEEKSK